MAYFTRYVSSLRLSPTSILFLLETATLYIYWYGWDAMQGNKKGLSYLFGTSSEFIRVLGHHGRFPTSWATFQVQSCGDWGWNGDLERAWAAMQNPTWMASEYPSPSLPMWYLGGFICGAYAGVRYLSGGQSREEKEHYDWMGYVGNFIGVFGMLPASVCRLLAHAGGLSIQPTNGHYPHGRILGMALYSAGHADRVFFLGANYYFWMGITYRIPGSEQSYKTTDS